jgi:hemoglobin-like flavoprotein
MAWDMTDRHVEIAEESYHRCAGAPGFFSAFYDLLLASDARIPPMFADTKFERQNKLLQHGLGILLIYAKRPNPALLERIATRHSRGDVGVAPELYPRFVEALVQAVERFDPEFGPEVADAWRHATEPGIAYMQARY